MKYWFFIFGLLFLLLNSFIETKPVTKSANHIIKDSTLKQRFIVSLLREHEQKGRWIFVKVERCKKQSAFEIVEPNSIFKVLSETNNNLSEKLFISIALEDLYIHNKIFSCAKETQVYYPKVNYEIEGKKVNMKKYNLLKGFSIEKILSTYFDSNKRLKDQYKKKLNELIAICYMNNVKVITHENGSVEYEVYK